MGIFTEENYSNAGAKDLALLNKSGNLVESAIREYDESSSAFKSKFSKVGKLLESSNILDNHKGALTLQAINQQKRTIEGLRDVLGEATVQSNLGVLNTTVLDVVGMFYPEQIAFELADIQTMPMSTGQIFTMKPKYTSTFDGVTAGDEMYINKTTNADYASESNTQTLDTGDGSTVTFTAVSLSPANVRPGTIRITVEDSLTSVVLGVDSGVNGDTTGLITGTGISAGTINYVTGAISVTFSAAPASGKDIYIEYHAYHDSSSSLVRQVEFTTEMVPVRADPHPIRFTYSVETMLNMRNHLGVDAEDVLTREAANLIKNERDQLLVKTITDNAYDDSTMDFDASSTTLYYSKTDRYGEIELKLNYAEKEIQDLNGRGGVDFVLCGRNAAQLFRKAPGFKPEPMSGSPKVGAYKEGTLRDGTVSVVYSPDMSANDYVVGFKGFQMGDAAIIMADYVPLYMTTLKQNAELTSEKGLLSMYALYLNNANYFRKGTVSSFTA